MPLSAARTLLCGTRYALYFDGIRSYGVVPSSDVLYVKPDITIEILFKCPRIGINELIAHHGNFTVKGWWVNRYSNNKLRFFTGAGAIWDYLESNMYIVDTAKFYHAFLIQKGYDKYIYINGELDNSKTVTFTIDWTRTVDLYIATDSPTAGFSNVTVALTRIYSRALSDKEIAWNFNHRDNPVRNGLIMWLHWDSIDIDAGKWYDKTVFGNHGTIYGATLIEPIKLKARTLSSVRSLSPAR